MAALYRARADAVAASLTRPAPPACVPLRGEADAAAAADDGEGVRPLSTDPNAPLDDAGAASRSALLGPNAPTAAPLTTSRARPDPAIRRLAPPASTAGLGKKAASTIDTQRALQESLTDDLVGLAAGLRANAEAARGAVEKRGHLVDGADAALDATLASARTAAAGAALAVRSSRRGFWAACLAFACVGGVFTATFLYIRATSLLGYSSARAARGAANRAAKAAAAAKALGVGDQGQHVEL